MPEVEWSEFLRPGEELLWTGRSSLRLVHFRWSDLQLLIPLASIAFLIVQLVRYSIGTATDYLVIGAIYAVGFLAFLSWIPYNFLLRRRTFYALTASRAVIRTGVFRPRNHVHQLGPTQLVETKIESDGTTTIVFDPDRRLSKARGSAVDWGRRGVNSLQFYRVSDAQRVVVLINQVQQLMRQDVETGPPLGPGEPEHIRQSQLQTPVTAFGLDWLPDIRPGEQILWVGRPSRHPIVFSYGDIFSLPLYGGLLYVTAMLAIEQMGSAGSLNLVLWAIVVTLVYKTFGRFVHDWLQRSRTQYALTNRRVLTRTGVIRTRTNSYRLNPIKALDYQIRPDGSGTIKFDEYFQFYRVPQVEYIKSLIDDSLAQITPRPELGPRRTGDLGSPATTDAGGRVAERWAPDPGPVQPPPRRSLGDISPPPGFDR